MLTSNYLHIGFLHILFNMWCLWDLGNLAERIFDRWTYVLTYTMCGLAGSLASLWWHPLVVGAGASGAIFGLAGALIAALYLGHLPIPKQAVQRTLRSLVIFAGYNLFLARWAQPSITRRTWVDWSADWLSGRYWRKISLRRQMSAIAGGMACSQWRQSYCWRRSAG